MKALLIPSMGQKLSLSTTSDNTLLRVRTETGATAHYDLSSGSVKEAIPTSASLQDLCVVESKEYGKLIYLLEIEPEEAAIQQDSPLQLRPGLLVEKDGIEYVFHFLTQIGTGGPPWWYLAEVYEAKNAQFVPADTTVVAMLDVLGYSAIIETESLQDLVFKLGKGLYPMAGVIPLFGSRKCLMSPGGVSWNPTEFSCSVAVVLDSVIIYVARPTLTPLSDTCRAVAYMMRLSLLMGWAMRGGVAFGEFYGNADTQIYVGKALLTAHKTELAQNWSGCTIDERLLERFPEEAESLRRERLIVNYQVPWKGPPASGASRVEWPTINWCQPHVSDRSQLEGILHRLHIEAPQSAKSKIDETLRFYEWIKTQGWLNCAELKVTAVERKGTQVRKRQTPGQRSRRPGV